MHAFRLLLLLALATSLLGCEGRRGGGGGADDDDDDAPSDSGPVTASVAGVSFPSLSGIFIDELNQGTQLRAVVATEGLGCSDYVAFTNAVMPAWEEYQETEDVDPYFEAIADAQRDLPGVPGWFLSFSITTDSPPVGEPLEEGAITVTASELLEGESQHDGAMFPIGQQIGVNEPSGSLTAYGDRVTGSLEGSAAYIEDWENNFGDEAEERDASFTLDVPHCDLPDFE